MISIIILLIVFVLIAVRRIGSIRLQIWQAMLLGAVGVLAARQISPLDALRAVNLDVMLFLFAMFVIGQALEESGYLASLTCRVFSRARSLDLVVLIILFGLGGLAALLMNDTVAIIGTPVVLLLAQRTGVQAKVLLLALAFAVTIGSVASPIGNPQNLIVAINGEVPTPFITFLKYLLAPTLVNLLLAYLLLRIFYRRHFKLEQPQYPEEKIADLRLARISQVSLVILVALILAKIVSVFVDFGFDFRLTYIALAAAAPVIVLSRRRLTIVRNIDWTTLVFFAAMFVLMASVWDSGFFQSAIGRLDIKLDSTSAIMGTSVLLSQLISNVPLVALYLPMLLHMGAGAREMMALAAGSTIAGNLSILGAASNVIIIQNAEKRSKETLTFLEFARLGAPLTVVNIAVYWLFFLLV